MPAYILSLSRIFSVTVEAQNVENAISLVQNCLGYSDDTSEEDREMLGARILELELLENEVDDVTDCC